MTGGAASMGASGDAGQFFRAGWTAFAPDARVAAWARAARPVAETLLADPRLRAQWLRCGGTWFAGVNVFPNDRTGAVAAAGVPALAGPAVAFLARHLGLAGFAWDAGQISVCMPGYPRPWDAESPAAFRFRRDRDAAHLDGLRRDSNRRRRLGETHDFILAIPLSETPPAASPLVVWEGSHERIRQALTRRYAAIPPADWAREDITEAYNAARQDCFETLPRVPVHVPLGGAYLVHRLALHGMAPWGAEGGTRPRMIAYFRPDTAPGRAPDWWLTAP